MHRLLRLCLWQVIFISMTTFSVSLFAFEEGGIRIRGPKATDMFPYDQYGPITSKDTLWNIALKVRPDPTLSVYQVMQALYQKNPQAFKENNLNHLNNGQYLKLPSIDEMRAINPVQAKSKSTTDDKTWQKKVAKTVKKKVVPPAELAIKKKDLDATKKEINAQLEEIDTKQTVRLETIQNDVLDSIDGLQAILKENENLNSRLSNFNEQLDVMQNEVAKGKEIKLQLNDVIALQQELLKKAEAREQELLLEKQKIELENDGITSQLWFKILMSTLPALSAIMFGAWLMRRKK
ncbi:MAG: pilus assembly protein FimV, partial [Colwellia sp.]